ncbi:hypothetical protein RF55_12357 [Lasius niger]|uniref:Uncharacterized protein n=1 Tax=Lasius niger TaxID=67767 RepID=A0A0J7KDD1_LASNI|nr:hypothetical protein RF55_12357 [Lasius niger]
MEAARTMLLDANLPKKYWGEAVVTAAYLQNRPTKHRSRIPYELWYGTRHSKAYKLLDNDTGKIVISRDVKFIEEESKEEEILMTLDTSEHCDVQAGSEVTPEQNGVDNLLTNTTNEIPDNPRNVQPQEEKERKEAPRRMTRANRGILSEQYAPGSMMVQEHGEPTCREEALSGPDADVWKIAMDDEIKSLQKNSTWVLQKVPNGTKTIGCKWVFKLKKFADERPDRFKARLVAQGFSQKYGTDYNEVFAPVVKHTTLRVLLSIAGQRGYKVRHLDAKTAFLNKKLSEEVYMTQSSRSEIAGKEDYGCRLIRSIYGLKQTAKAWNDRLNEVLSDLSCYLGIQVRKNKNGNFLISQSEYIKKFLENTRLSDSKGSTTPMNTGYAKLKTNSPEIDNHYYQKLIGTLLYIAVNTRPDIAAPVAILSQFIKAPRKINWIELKRIGRYLKHTIDYELRLNNNDKKNTMLVGFADAN